VHTVFWWGKVRERDHLVDPGVDGRIILRWIFQELVGGMDWIVLARDMDACKRGNEPSGSINCGDFLY